MGGHEAGLSHPDDMLRFVAEELNRRVPPTDLAARFGGDEFVLVLQGVGAGQVESKAVELMEHFDRLEYDPGRLALPCGASVGSASMDAGTPSLESVLREANLDVYEAKRGRVNATRTLH